MISDTAERHTAPRQHRIENSPASDRDGRLRLIGWAGAGVVSLGLWALIILAGNALVSLFG